MFVGVFRNKLLASRNLGDKNGLVDITPGIENGVGNQTLYMTYKSITEAKTAFSKLNNLKFDNNHRMNCTWVNDIRAIIEEDSQGNQGPEFKAPNLTSFKERREHNLDEQFRSHFVMREDKMVYLQLLDHLDKSAKSALSGDFMQLGHNVNKMVFSPKGSYLAVCGSEGTHLYVGPELKYKGLLRQVNAVDAKFSLD